ncbi:MAG: hypothetical protein RIR49_446 [Actinomycetota bacterium]|jgi:hypothetical protein
MEPTLVAGQGIIAIRWRRRRPGQIRVMRHPTAPMWMVKRLAHRVPPAEGADGDRWHVTADDPLLGVDSRTLGSIDLSDSWLVVIVVPRRWM